MGTCDQVAMVVVFVGKLRGEGKRDYEVRKRGRKGEGEGKRDCERRGGGVGKRKREREREMWEMEGREIRHCAVIHFSIIHQCRDLLVWM